MSNLARRNLLKAAIIQCADDIRTMNRLDDQSPVTMRIRLSVLRVLTNEDLKELYDDYLIITEVNHVNS
jgi:hypothetical protein